MMLILPEDYKKIWKEKHECDQPVTKITKHRNDRTKRKINSWLFSRDNPLIQFAEIRKSSGRVGEHRWRYLSEIGSITLTEDYTTQKRWYRCMVAYNEKGTMKGKPPMEFLYLFIDNWMLTRLATEQKNSPVAAAEQLSE
jgi:hypothetical protein